MSFRTTLTRFALAVVLCCAVLHGRSGVGEEVLKNEDVVKMVSAGFGEGIIVVKVREAPQVDFKLSVDDLVALRNAGVSERVVQAMLERSKPAPRNPAYPVPAGSEEMSVSLKTVEGMSPLHPIKMEDMSTAGFQAHPALPFTGSTFMNFPGLRSTVRTHDRRPVLLVTRSSAPEVGHYFFAKLDSDKRNEVRSLKIGQALRRKRAPGGALAPDKDWVIPFEVAQESPGIWRITVTRDLQPGEYGWYVNLTDVMSHPELMLTVDTQGGELFDFGVD